MTDKNIETVNVFDLYEPGDDLFPAINLPNGVTVSSWLGDDGAMVFEIATTADVNQRVRVYVNEGDVYDDVPSDDPKMVYSTGGTK